MDGVLEKKQEDNEDWFVSAKNRELIISDLKVFAWLKRENFLRKMGKWASLDQLYQSLIFKKLTYNSEFFLDA